MTLKQLQERYEELATEQNTIYTKAGSSELTPDQETRFDAITIELKELTPKMQRAKQVEENAVAIAMKDAKIEAPAVHTKEHVFDISKAVRSAVEGKWNDAVLEKDIMQKSAQQNGSTWNEHRILINPNQRADAYSVVGTAADGGNLVGTEYREDKFVDQLWNMSILGKLNVVNNTGMVGNQSIAVATNKVTANIVGEVDAIADSEKLTFGIKTATPKEMVTHGQFSRQLDLTSRPAIRRLFQNQIMMAISNKLDDLFIQGSSPTGILTLTTGGAAGQTKTIALGTNGAALTYANLVQMKTELAKKNVAGDLRFITNAQVTGTLMTTLKDTANTASGYILGENQNTLLRFPVIESQTVPYTLTKGSASAICSAIILGNFAESEIFQWGNIAIEFDPYTGAGNSLIKVKSFSFWDMVHKRPENFVIIKDVLTMA